MRTVFFTNLLMKAAIIHFFMQCRWQHRASGNGQRDSSGMQAVRAAGQWQGAAGSVFALVLGFLFLLAIPAAAGAGTAVDQNAEPASAQATDKAVEKPVNKATDIGIEVRGVSGALKENILAYVGKISVEDMQAWRTTRGRITQNLHDGMQAMGYYDARYEIDRTHKAVLLTVTPGQPILVRKISLVFNGEAGNDIAFTALRESLPLHEGDVFHHGQYESMKTAVQSLGVERGYFDAEWEVHEVSIDTVAHTADIDLAYNSGERYRFGPVTFVKADGGEQDLVTPSLLQRFLQFSEGDPYTASEVIKFNKVLLDSRYFSEVRVHVDRDKVQDHAVPVSVLLRADEPNHVDFGVGYSTDVRERISVKARRPLLNTRGHSIEANAELSPVRSTFDTKYTVPLTHPINDTLQYFYGVKREDVESVVTWNTVLGLRRQIKNDSEWQRTYSLRFNRDTTETQYDPVVKKDLVLPGISFDRTRIKGGIDPYWGDRQFYQMEVASEKVLSDATLVSLRGGWRFLRTLADRHQFLLRGDAGTIVTTDFDNVPQSMRFFAGGDQSIRGYGYKSISPRDENGVAVGARNLLTGSVEYDYTVIAHWRAAVFVDGGSAFDTVNEPVNIGSGVGMRWVSPVGPIRLDLAWAVTEPGHPFRLHFSMGPNL